jgi:hypothetical protein
MTKQPVEQPRHITVLQSETRKIGDNYRKLEFGAESDLIPDSTWEDGFRNLHRVVQTALETAMKTKTEIVIDESQRVPDKELRGVLPTTPIRSDNPYEKKDGWNPSQKRKNLRTRRVTAEMLADPELKRLYDDLLITGKLGLMVGDKKYTIWKTPEGSEIISEWSRQQIG